MKQIPWSQAIKTATPITSNKGTKLGTGRVKGALGSAPNFSNSANELSSAIGLYEGHTCNNAFPKKWTWQPGREVTNMEDMALGLGAGNEILVAQILDSKGVKRKMKVPEKPPIEINSNSRASDEKKFYEVFHNKTNKKFIAK